MVPYPELTLIYHSGTVRVNFTQSEISSNTIPVDVPITLECNPVDFLLETSQLGDVFTMTVKTGTDFKSWFLASAANTESFTNYTWVMPAWMQWEANNETPAGPITSSTAGTAKYVGWKVTCPAVKTTLKGVVTVGATVASGPNAGKRVLKRLNIRIDCVKEESEQVGDPFVIPNYGKLSWGFLTTESTRNCSVTPCTVNSPAPYVIGRAPVNVAPGTMVMMAYPRLTSRVTKINDQNYQTVNSTNVSICFTYLVNGVPQYPNCAENAQSDVYGANSVSSWTNGSYGMSTQSIVDLLFTP